ALIGPFSMASRRTDEPRYMVRWIAAAVRKASAARVSVGFAVALVGKTLEPTIQRFGTSCALPQRSTTESLESSPMTHVPMMCAAVFQLTRLVLGLSSSFAVGGWGMVAFITPN